MNKMTDFTELFYKTRGGKIRVKQGSWKKVENHKIYAKWLKEKLRYENEEDWYKITAKEIIDYHGGGLLRAYYNNSPQQFVKEMFPHYEWKVYKFSQVPKEHWYEIKNRKEYANDLGKHLGYTKMEDWYKITQQQIIDYHGGGLLYIYNGSPQQFVKEMFPHYEWKVYKFIQVHKEHWYEIKNRKEYANDLGKHLGYTNMEHWYDITYEKIYDYHGGGLLVSYYNGSPQQFVKEMFPHYEWKVYKFIQVHNGHWDEIKNRKEYANDLGKHLGYTKMEDWYKITQQQIIDYHGRGLLYIYNNSPQQFVKAMFPDYPWINSKFKKNYSQGQIQWLKYMCVSTPDIRHILNHDDGEYKIPGSRYYADGYSDEELCIFEYHGDYWHGNPKFHNQEKRFSTRTTFGELYEKALKKQRFCEESGYNFVFIWESEWIRAKLAVIKLQQKWKNKKN
jgi:hypothetical protein